MFFAVPALTLWCNLNLLDNTERKKKVGCSKCKHLNRALSTEPIQMLPSLFIRKTVVAQYCWAIISQLLLFHLLLLLLHFGYLCALNSTTMKIFFKSFSISRSSHQPCFFSHARTTGTQAFSLKPFTIPWLSESTQLYSISPVFPAFFLSSFFSLFDKIYCNLIIYTDGSIHEAIISSSGFCRSLLFLSYHLSD